MTHKRCRKTGRKAKVEATGLMNKGDVIYLSAEDTTTRQCGKFFVAYCDYHTACERLLRDETKLDRLLDGCDNE